MERHEIKSIIRGGQLTLPKWFRTKFDLKEGDAIELIEESDSIRIRPLNFLYKKQAVRNLIQFLDQSKDIKCDLSEENILNTTQKQ